MSLRYNRANIERAKELRKNATPQENHLWYDFLAKHKVRFQRQKAIGEYIVDFYCHKAKLVIEIDGSQHFTEEGLHSDRVRTDYLEQMGLKVVRFSNREVDRNFQTVCDYVDSLVQSRVGSLPEGAVSAAD